MLKDITGIELTPGNNGKDCLGNGKYFYKNGKAIECCCDECDYMICCFVMENFSNCPDCDETLCPRKNTKKIQTHHSN